MLVNYYYVCIRTHDSKPWRRVIGIGLKENDEKKPADRAGLIFSGGGQIAGAKADPSLAPLQALLTNSFMQ
jgi:hypothetical protein